MTSKNANKKTVLNLALASAFVLVSAQLQAQVGNTTYGANALISVTTGRYNSAFGNSALYSNTTGWYNTASGYYALYKNSRNENTAVGYNSMYENTTGEVNTAIGSLSLANNTTGSSNTASGAYSLNQNITGSFNTANGNYALFSNTTGSWNSTNGSYSLYFNTTGYDNTASGAYSLHQNITGYRNTASGYYALHSNSIGAGNTANGSNSLYSNTTGNNNTASGNSSLYSNTAGYQNAAFGYNTLYDNTTGFYNAALGAWALPKNTEGNFNTAFGTSALNNNTTGTNNAAQGALALKSNITGSRNLAIGAAAGYAALGNDNVFLGYNAEAYETGSNRLYISSNATTPLLYGVFSPTASANKLGIGTKSVAAGQAINVWNGAHLTIGGVWTNASSRDLKDNIETLSTEDANKALATLSPVRYVYKNSPDEQYVGFIAEDVPELVASNDRKSLSPMDIVAVLTTVTKQQKSEIAEQKAMMTEKLTQKDAEIAALRDSLARQDQRMVQMEMTLAELLRNQSSESQVASAD